MKKKSLNLSKLQLNEEKISSLTDVEMKKINSFQFGIMDFLKEFQEWDYLFYIPRMITGQTYY